MRHRILVVGGLAAGPSAASKAKRVNPDADVGLFERGEHVSYGICEIPYYFGKVFDDPGLLQAYTPQRLEKEKGIRVRTLHEVEEIRSVKKTLVVRDLSRGKVEEIPYDRLVLATGSNPRRLGLNGEDGRNVFNVKTLHEAFALKKFLNEEHPRRAVIVGAGYIGMEMAEALVANGIHTTILHRSEFPMSGLEEETRKEVAEELRRKGVEFVPRAVVRELISDGTGRVITVRTKSEEYSADLVVVAIGVEPNTGLAQTARIHRGAFGGILTDQRQATNIDSIFAAGDCCEVKNLVSNSSMYIPLASIASRQAWVAGENAAGGSAVFKGALHAIAVKVFDLQVARVGLSLQQALSAGFDAASERIEGNSRGSFFPGNERIRIVAVADRKSRRLLGANLVGKDGSVLRADILAVAIQHRMNVDELSHLDLIYTPPFSPLWDPILVLAHQLRKLK